MRPGMAFLSVLFTNLFTNGRCQGRYEARIGMEARGLVRVKLGWLRSRRRPENDRAADHAAGAFRDPDWTGLPSPLDIMQLTDAVQRVRALVAALAEDRALMRTGRGARVSLAISAERQSAPVDGSKLRDPELRDPELRDPEGRGTGLRGTGLRDTGLRDTATPRCFDRHAMSSSGAAHPSERADHADTPEGPETTILVVEDEDHVRSVTARMLQLAGFSVVEARDPVQALATLDASAVSIDLCITDLVMPHMDGRDFAEHLAVRLPDTPVLFVSGYPDGCMEEGGWSAPQDSFLSKPYLPAELVDRVRAMLAERDASGEAAAPSSPSSASALSVPSSSASSSISPSSSEL